MGRDRIEWISHDSYYRNFDRLSPEERRKINFDHPDSIESELLARHLDVEFVEPSKRHGDLIIPEGGENQVAIDAIISRVEQLLAPG